MNKLLLIFVKHPVAGKAKTRLAASLGNEKALAIYQKLLEYTLRISQEIFAHKVVFYGNEVPEKDLWSEAAYQRFLQQGNDLGARMEQAFEWGFGQGFEKILIIGSDNARLKSSHLHEAFMALEKEDVVIGPAKDGGYYLLGMKELIPELFRNKQWSTETVLSDTVIDAQMLKLKVAKLEELSDVDVEADLEGTFLEDFIS